MSQIFLTYKGLLPLIPFVVAFLSVCWIHPRLVKLAYLKGIVDNPDFRKLQRSPVPVLGGCAVFFGISLGLGIVSPFFDSSQLPIIMAAMTLMLYIGTMDDILNLSPGFRFFVEVLCLVLLVVAGFQYQPFPRALGYRRHPVLVVQRVAHGLCRRRHHQRHQPHRRG